MIHTPPMQSERLNSPGAWQRPWAPTAGAGGGSATDAEVLDWKARSIANGGSVNDATLAAVNTFMGAIKTAGLRAKIYRLNLFCGNDFVHANNTDMGAVQVPLIKDWGGALDTNGAAATGWSYNETGVNGGLQTSAGASLGTGLIPNATAMTLTNVHVAAYVRTALNEASHALQGQHTVSPFSAVGLIAGPYSDQRFYTNCCDTDNSGAPLENLGVGFYLATRNSNVSKKYFKNGVLLATNAVDNSTQVVPNREIGLFANYGGSPSSSSFCSKRLGGYSIGTGFTDTEVLAFYNAMQAFQTALSRNV